MKQASKTNTIRRTEDIITNTTKRVGGKGRKKDRKPMLDPGEHGGLAGVFSIQGTTIGFSWGWEVDIGMEEGVEGEGGAVDGAGGIGGGRGGGRDEDMREVGRGEMGKRRDTVVSGELYIVVWGIVSRNRWIGGQCHAE